MGLLCVLDVSVYVCRQVAFILNITKEEKKISLDLWCWLSK